MNKFSKSILAFIGWAALYILAMSIAFLIFTQFMLGVNKALDFFGLEAFDKFYIFSGEVDLTQFKK